jgi:hypothetical protein
MHEPDPTIRVIIFVAVFLALDSTNSFYNRRCQERFGVEPLKMPAIAWWVVLVTVIHLGDVGRRHFAEIGRDKPEGLILMGLGAVGVIASLVSNVRRTNIVYGMAGTALKFAFGWLYFLFANYTVIGWLFLPGLLAASVNDEPRRGRPHIPLPGEANWNDYRWNDPRWRDPRWANLVWDDPRFGKLPWHDRRWDDPEWEDPRSP